MPTPLTLHGELHGADGELHGADGEAVPVQDLVRPLVRALQAPQGQLLLQRILLHTHRVVVALHPQLGPLRAVPEEQSSDGQ